MRLTTRPWNVWFAAVKSCKWGIPCLVATASGTKHVCPIGLRGAVVQVRRVFVTSLHVMIFGVLETQLRHICACVLNMPWSSPTTLQISSYSSSVVNPFWSLSKEINAPITITGAGFLLQVVFLYRTDTEAWTGRLLTLDTVSTDADLYNFFALTGSSSQAKHMSFVPNTCALSVCPSSDSGEYKHICTGSKSVFAYVLHGQSLHWVL